MTVRQVFVIAVVGSMVASFAGIFADADDVVEVEQAETERSGTVMIQGCKLEGRFEVREDGLHALRGLSTWERWRGQQTVIWER